MKQNRMKIGVGASLCMLILILDGKTAIEGARTGIDLCLRTVIPALFPFVMLSILLCSAFAGSPLPLLSPLGRLCGIPKGLEFLLITGFLGGYPVGAQSTALAWKSGVLTKEEAQRILAFCSNAGPAFLFGIIGPVFSSRWTPWLLWAIHISSALLTALCLPVNCTSARNISPRPGISITSGLNTALRAMGAICGWVVLFRILIGFLQRWVLWYLPPEWEVSLIGLVELSNGCLALSQISDPRLRFVVCSVILSAGGACVALQTAAVTQGLSQKFYYIGKMLQSLFSLAFSLCFAYSTWVLCLPIFGIVCLRMQKSCSNRRPVGV